MRCEYQLTASGFGWKTSEERIIRADDSSAKLPLAVLAKTERLYECSRGLTANANKGDSLRYPEWNCNDNVGNLCWCLPGLTHLFEFRYLKIRILH